jgi:hypothetical protein
MQIILQPLPSGTPIPLTGTKPTEGVSGGAISHSRIMEAIARIRADSMRYRPRQNAAHQITFAINREHDSEGAAALYWLTHAQSLPDSCDVRFRVQRFSGDIFAEVLLEDAIVTAQAGEWAGCSTTFNYQILGGKFST